MNRRYGWRARVHDESGVALIIVTLALSALLLLSTAAIEFSTGSLSLSKHDQSWNAALSAAEGGIDDYLFRLNENSNYWAYSDTNTPPDGNKAFVQWVDVPGGTTQSSYRYKADASTLKVDGTIKLTSSGKVGTTTRTVYTTLRRRSFIDYLYFTDYETLDPSLYTGSPFTPAQAQIKCSKHYYDGRDPSCVEITFATFDKINGPLHSNDAYLICGGATFNGATSTSWTGASGLRYRPNTGCGTGTPKFANPGDPALLPPLTMPPSNTSIKAETVAGAGGCLYTGPTSILMNSDGTMTVNSKFSKNTNNGCVTNGTGPLPTSGVIYVQTVPASTTDPNYTSGCPFTVNGKAHPLGLPISGDVTTYGCRNGDAFVQGTTKGQVTIASDNNTDVTGNLLYQGGLNGSDLLGLVANNFVEVYHPAKCTSTSGGICTAGTDLSDTFHPTWNFASCASPTAGTRCATLDAAMLSVQHSVRVQNYNLGSVLGTLTINGAFAQRFRGIVGTSSGGVPQTGYAKNYTYDPRLKYLSPPKFLDPVASAWGQATWSEVRTPVGW
jgi:hypothetical protein